MCKLLQGIAGLPGPIGVDGGPGLPGQKGEKVILNYSFCAYKDPKCIITKKYFIVCNIYFFLQGEEGVGIQGVQGPHGEKGEKVPYSRHEGHRV